MTKNRDKIVNRDITKNITPYRSPLATPPQIVPSSRHFTSGGLCTPLISGIFIIIKYTFTFSHLADAFIQSDLRLGNT